MCVYIYIYTYIYVCVCLCVFVWFALIWYLCELFNVKAILVEQLGDYEAIDGMGIKGFMPFPKVLSKSECNSMIGV